MLTTIQQSTRSSPDRRWVDISARTAGSLAALLFSPFIAAAQGSPIEEAIRLVSDSSIAADVRHLESWGTRYALNENRFDIAEWIRGRFVKAGLMQADTLGFFDDSSGTWQRNVEATLPGTSHGSEEIIIGAHYDSQSSDKLAAPGADDNASGVAGIIEIARVLTETGYRPTATIRFVAFAAEELVLRGSKAYVGRALASGQNIRLMQNYDMIAYRNQDAPDRHVAINEYLNAPDEAALLQTLTETYTTLTPHRTMVNSHRSDSWAFYTSSFKAVFMIEDENDFNPHYHSPHDSSVHLDFTYAKEIVQAGIALTLTIDGQILNGSPEPDRSPGQWSLQQNHPNPFNPLTRITYSLASRSYVRLHVYSLLGVEVAELEDSEIPAGTHTATWIPRVPSGAYYYTLEVIPESGNGSPGRQTKKMLLLR